MDDFFYLEPYLAQFRNPEGYFRHLASRAYLQFRVSPSSCYYKIPNPDFHVRQIPFAQKNQLAILDRGFFSTTSPWEVLIN